MPEFSHPSKFKLKLAYWYVTHKNQLKKIFVILCFCVCVLFAGYGLFGLIYYFAAPNEFEAIISGLAKSNIDFELYQKTVKPQELQIKSTSVIKTSQTQADYLAVIQNPNQRWLIKKISYQFVSDNFVSQVSEDFILPNQTKYLFALNQPVASVVKLKIIDLEYQRIKAEPDVFLYQLDIRDSDYLPGTSQNFPRVKFKITNASIYNFWEMPVKIILYSRSIPVGVNLTAISELKSDETREVEFVWFENLPYTVSQVEITPDLNIFDQSNFMPPDKEVGELK